MNLVPCSIYKIFSESDPSIVYIGSTSRDLKQRLCEHKSNYQKVKAGMWTTATSRAFKIFDLFDPENCQIIAIDHCTNENRHQREQVHIDNHPKCVNKNKAFIENKEEYRRNYIKKYMREYMPKYYEQNKDKKLLYYQRHKLWKNESSRMLNVLID